MGKVQSLEKGDAGYNDLFLDQDLRTKEKMSKFLKAACAASFYHKISPRSSSIKNQSAFYHRLIELDGFSWRDDKSRILK